MKKTSLFKYFNFPFETFNPAQSKVIPYVEKDSNLIISFYPGTGKTAIAEACFGYHLKSLEQTVAYISPLRSLANQKLKDWKISFKEYKPFLISSDSKIRIEEITDNRLGLFTAESFDSAIRRNSNFIKNLGCVCYDEAHLIGDQKRGLAYETSIIKMSDKDVRFVLLSGTLTNSKELAKWLKNICRSSIRCSHSWATML